MSNENLRSYPAMTGEMPMLPTLGDYQDTVKHLTNWKCPNCQERLGPQIDRYDHDGGWLVAGFERRQWLSIKCSGCHYEWSLWKLGVAGDVDHLPTVQKAPLRDLALELELSGRAEVDGQ
jgi:hypothetical protein